MVKYGYFPAVIATAAALFFGLFTGCATAVDKGEVEQKSNPVRSMHTELKTVKDSTLEWQGYDDALTKARKESKFVMVDFFTTWCKWCKKLDTDTYSDPRVVAALRDGFIPVKVDAESSKKVVHEMRQITMAKLAEEFKVSGYPAVWFMDKDGKRVKLLNGYLPPDDFLKYLEYIKSGAFKDMEFEAYATKGGGGK